ncbi:MAG TPA: class I SAM-dependent methyltransferase [Jatrophihabitans sp.]|nr:class I SAM-dependent methyltransferase [Jatrophihabitans sp.]
MHRHDPSTHTQRHRAESFGRVAGDYDRYRPGYPATLVDDLLARRPANVLDVGCGTGKAGRLFAARGVPVLGVEIDPQMAALARSHGLIVEEGSFEEWDSAGRTFDLITAAQSWHWVDPVAGAAKAAGLLRPGGELAVFWNFEDLAADEQAIVESVYRELAPELLPDPDRRPSGAGSDGQHRRRLEESGCFAAVDAVTYPAELSWPVAEWLGYVGTQSGLLQLGPRLPGLLERLRSALFERGPLVRATGGTYLIRATV